MAGADGASWSRAASRTAGTLGSRCVWDEPNARIRRGCARGRSSSFAWRSAVVVAISAAFFPRRHRAGRLLIVISIMSTEGACRWNRRGHEVACSSPRRTEWSARAPWRDAEVLRQSGHACSPWSDFLERFRAASRRAFAAVEYPFPYAHEWDAAPALLEAQACLRCCSTCQPATGSRRSAASLVSPSAVANFKTASAAALEYARGPRLHHAQLPGRQRPLACRPERASQTLVDNLAVRGARARRGGCAC
jgi:hypothetical protein